MTIEQEMQKAVEKAIAPLFKEFEKMREEINGQKPLIGTAEKARLEGVTPETIRRRCRSGKMKFAKRSGNQFMFHG